MTPERAATAAFVAAYNFVPSERWGTIKAWLVNGAPTREQGVQMAAWLTSRQVALDAALAQAQAALGACSCTVEESGSFVDWRVHGRATCPVHAFPAPAGVATPDRTTWPTREGLIRAMRTAEMVDYGLSREAAETVCDQIDALGSASRRRHEAIADAILALVPAPEDAADNWLVVRKRETDPPEVWQGNKADMRDLYERASLQWTETFLARVVSGPSDPASTKRPPPEDAEAIAAQIVGALFAFDEEDDRCAVRPR